jgi:hypothetical protein
MRAEFLKFVGPKGAGPTEASYFCRQKKKAYLPTYLPTSKIVGRVRGNRNIFNCGLKISIFWRNESKIRNFQQSEFWAKWEKKSDGKFPIKKIQSANFDRVGRLRGNKLIFNFGLMALPNMSRSYWFLV